MILSSRRRLLLAVGSTGTLGFSSPLIHAQSGSGGYPNKPIKLLVGYSPGGGVDAVARLIAPRLSQILGQQVVVENRAGAAGLIAAEATSKAPNDGYTIMLADSSTLIAKHLKKDLSLDPLKALVPVAAVANAPLVIIVNNNFPASNPKEFVAALKANPGRYSFATAGIGTVQHLAFEMIKAKTGSFVVHIPYRGAAQILPDVIGDIVPIGVVSAAAALVQMRAKKVKAVAALSAVKLSGGGSSSADDVAPLADAIPGFDAAPRLVIVAPAGTPDAIIAKLSDAVKSIISAPEYQPLAANQGAIAPPSLQSLSWPSESEQWAQVIRTQRITGD